MPTQKATITKQGAGSSNQTITLGSAIVPYSFAWNYASTVTVTGMPAGILVDINNTTKTVSISGTPTQTGVFNYALTTVGGSPDSTRKGSITVTTVTDLLTEDLATKWHVYPNPTAGNVTIEKMGGIAEIKIFNALGILVTEARLLDKLVLGDELPAGTYTVSITENEQIKIMRFVKNNH
jgi:hypothetical protein